MQENLKQEKRFRTLNIIAICLLLVLFTASLFLAVIAPVFTSNGVASAIDVSLPDDGFVNSNLLRNSDFSIKSSSLTSWTSRGKSVLTVDNWYLFNGDASYSDSVPRINFDSTQVGSVYSRFYSSTFILPAGTYTITGCYNFVSGGGTSRLRLNNTGASSFDDYSGATYVNLVRSPGVHISSFVITLNKSYSVNVDYYSSAPSEGFIADLYWIKVEKGSSFTGYVPDYENNINDLQNQLNQANQEKQELQDNYDKLSESLQFSVLSSLSLSNTVMYRSDTQQNLFSSARQISVNNVSYQGYHYFFDGGTNQNSNRKYLFKWELDSSVPSGNDVKFYADLVTFWDGVGVVPGDNYYLGVYYSYNDFDSYNREFNSGWIYYSLSDLNKFYSDSRFFTFDVNAVYFDLFQLDQGVYVSVPLQSSVTNKDGLFLSGFSLLMRSNSVDSLVDSARQDGYISGYQSGKSTGYNEGYSKGLADSGSYSFMGLLGAVFDAPIQAFKGLLSFEVLGVNMSSFVASLFGLAVILLILKLILGGGK